MYEHISIHISTYIYIYLHISTYIYIYHHLSTYITYIYIYLHISTYIYLSGYIYRLRQYLKFNLWLERLTPTKIPCSNRVRDGATFNLFSQSSEKNLGLTEQPYFYHFIIFFYYSIAYDQEILKL